MCLQIPESEDCCFRIEGALLNAQPHHSRSLKICLVPRNTQIPAYITFSVTSTVNFRPIHGQAHRLFGIIRFEQKQINSSVQAELGAPMP